MSVSAVQRRGQPLVFLLVLLGGWMTLRLATWENPWPQEILRSLDTPALERMAAIPDLRAMPAHEERAEAARREGPDWAVPVPIAAPPPVILPASAQTLPVFVPGRTMTGHNIVWMAAMSRLPMPASVVEALDKNARVERGEIQLPQSAREDRKRWRFDGWLLLRGEGKAAFASRGPVATYGGSQLGGVLSYRLSSASAHDPALYLRANAALREPRETEAAFGLRARPIADVPVTLHAEARLSQRQGSAQVRPSVFATAGFERSDLPLGLVLRGYGQAGYVAGRNASAFADGLAVAGREVAQFDLSAVSADLNVGAGVWGGAQKGASRVDVGPTTSTDVRLGEVSARVSVDYRIRVAGDAEPGNGPAFTLSTGF